MIERFNAQYLADLLKFLDTASAEQAINAYRGVREEKEGDDWLFAELGKNDLFFLLTAILRRPDVNHPWLYERVREVEHSPDGHLDLWSREHFKSTIITFGLTVQDILRDPEITVGIFSHNRPIAKAFLRQIKSEFEGNEMLKDLYPGILWRDPKKDSTKWSEDEGIVVRRQGNPKESTVEAWGLVDGQPISKHFRLMVFDDVVTRESCATPEMMAKTTSALETAYSLGQEGGIRRFIGTRYHFNDSYRTLIERGTAQVRLYNGTVDNCGDIKRPVLWSKELMAEKRRDMGAYVFGCQVLQNPKADAIHGFKREWLRYYDDVQAGRGLNKYILVDPANSKKEAADYTNIWVIGLGPDENYYALEIVRDRLNLTERCTRVVDLHRKWKPLEVRYEHYGMQADTQALKTYMETVQYRFEVLEVGGTIPKPERIKRLIPLFENGKVWLPRSLHVTTVDHETLDLVARFIEDEFMAFPVPVHDDMLDSLARITDDHGWKEVGDKKERVKLTLKWPSKLARSPNIPAFPCTDSGVGM